MDDPEGLLPGEKGPGRTSKGTTIQSHGFHKWLSGGVLQHVLHKYLEGQDRLRSSMRHLGPAVSAVILLLMQAGMAAAHVWHVPIAVPTVAAALDSAAAGDTVLVTPGVYPAHDLLLKSGVTLRGSTGNPSQVVLDAQLQGRILSGSNLEPGTLISDLSFVNGYAAGEPGGAVQVSGGTLVLRGCRFLDNQSDSHGGALYLGDCDSVTVDNCFFLRNSSYTPDVSAWGGAVALFSADSQSTLRMAHCTLDSSSSGGPGGAIGMENGNLYLTDCEITGSRSGLRYWAAGAGIFARRYETQPSSGPVPDLEVVIADCRFVGNIGLLPVVDPYAADGGGVLVRGHDADHRYSVHVTNSWFSENYNAQGAGIYVGRFCNGLIQWSTFYRNRAFLDGGAANKGGAPPESQGETARFEYCLFQENDCGSDQNGVPAPTHGKGGAFMTRYYPRGELLNCTFVNNRCGGALHRGDAIYHYGEGMAFTDSLQKCLLINNVFYGDNGVDVQVRGDAEGFTEVAHCAYGPGQFVCTGVVPTGTVTLLESPFQSDLDLHLRPGSLCIDAGVDLGFGIDLDGQVVPQGAGPDIGAYESQDLSSAGVVPAAASPRLTAYPNPFNPLTTLAFDLPRPGPVVLEIFAVDGSRVRRLLVAEHPAGPGRVIWDGRDDTGRPVPSAAYLARLAGPGGLATCRLLLVK
jgi:hypothetical protein